jgi:hypothetical protein
LLLDEGHSDDKSLRTRTGPRPVDRNIPLIHVGDQVRIVGLSDLSDISPEALAETLPVFQFLMRKYTTPS